MLSLHTLLNLSCHQTTFQKTCPNPLTDLFNLCMIRPMISTIAIAVLIIVVLLASLLLEVHFTVGRQRRIVPEYR